MAICFFFAYCVKLIFIVIAVYSNYRWIRFPHNADATNVYAEQYGIRLTGFELDYRSLCDDYSVRLKLLVLYYSIFLVSSGHATLKYDYSVSIRVMD